MTRKIVWSNYYLQQYNNTNPCDCLRTKYRVYLLIRRLLSLLRSSPVLVRCMHNNIMIAYSVEELLLPTARSIRLSTTSFTIYDRNLL